MASPTFSTRFCNPTADITLRSCDGMLFKFYRKWLEAHSLAFAGGEGFPSTVEETIDLAETSEVVELLLQLMSLEKHPNLMTLEFSVLAQLADAIEKYEVMSAMNICDMAMRSAIPKGHAVEVLDWAARGGYVDTMDEAAPVTVGYRLARMKNLRSSPVIAAWLHYFQHWLDALDDAYALVQDPHLRCHGSCSGCEAIVLALACQLRARPRVLLDLDKVFDPVKRVFGDSPNGHLDVKYVQQMVTAQIIAIPKFSTLL